MLYLQYEDTTISPNELRDITNQLEDTTITHGKSPRKWAIMTEDEVKIEYDVTWTRDKLEETIERITELEETIEQQDKDQDELHLTIAKLKDQILTLQIQISDSII